MAPGWQISCLIGGYQVKIEKNPCFDHLACAGSYLQRISIMRLPADAGGNPGKLRALASASDCPPFMSGDPVDPIRFPCFFSGDFYNPDAFIVF